MKKTLLTLTAGLAFFASCRKEAKQAAQPNKLSTHSMAAKVTDKKMEDYLTYKDPAQTQMNNNMFLYLKGMQAIFNDQPELLSLLYSKVQVDRQNGLFLKKFINGSAKCSDAFTKTVCKINTALNPKINQSLALADQMSCQKIGYDPAIVLYNPEYADLQGEYYLALLVEDNGPEEDGKEYIPALHVMANGSSQLELIDYYDSYYQSIPVFEFLPILNANYAYMGGQLTAHEANESDPETYHPLGRLEPGTYFPPRAYDPSRHPSPVAPLAPDPKSVVHEGVNLYDHKEEIGASEYYLSTRVSRHSIAAQVIEDQEICSVPRNVVDCGCYQSLYNYVYLTNPSDVVDYTIITYEHDGWASFHQYTDPASGITLGYKASLGSDVYLAYVLGNPAADFPSAGNSKALLGPTATHILRRY